MIEFELLNTPTGLLISGDKYKSYFSLAKSTARLWHDLVEHFYDPKANGWEDELIALGRQLSFSYVPHQVNTSCPLASIWIRNNVNYICEHRSKIRKCPYQYSNKEQTKVYGKLDLNKSELTWKIE